MSRKNQLGQFLLMEKNVACALDFVKSIREKNEQIIRAHTDGSSSVIIVSTRTF